MNTSYRVMIQANNPNDAVWSGVMARHQQILLKLFQHRKHVSPPGNVIGEETSNACIGNVGEEMARYM